MCWQTHHGSSPQRLEKFCQNQRCGPKQKRDNSDPSHHPFHLSHHESGSVSSKRFLGGGGPPGAVSDDRGHCLESESLCIYTWLQSGQSSPGVWQYLTGQFWVTALSAEHEEEEAAALLAPNRCCCCCCWSAETPDRGESENTDFFFLRVIYGSVRSDFIQQIPAVCGRNRWRGGFRAASHIESPVCRWVTCRF